MSNLEAKHSKSWWVGVVFIFTLIALLIFLVIDLKSQISSAVGIDYTQSTADLIHLLDNQEIVDFDFFEKATSIEEEEGGHCP
jgi:hypothetical protein